MVNLTQRAELGAGDWELVPRSGTFAGFRLKVARPQIEKKTNTLCLCALVVKTETQDPRHERSESNRLPTHRLLVCWVDLPGVKYQGWTDDPYTEPLEPSTQVVHIGVNRGQDDQS
jgi:hypothetical protein